MKELRVLLADDHAIVRQGLRSLIESGGTAKVVGEADDGREAVLLAEKMAPDVIIMDIAMPRLNGLEAVRQVKERFPEIKVIILSMYVEDVYVYQALKAGANGYVLKSAAFEELKLAFDAIKRGEIYLSATVSQVLVREFLKTDPSPEVSRLLEKLTPREREVVQLLAEGKSRGEIAQTLLISPKTVDRHRENLKSKLNICKEKDFLHFARVMGIVDF
ncbi:MAG: response regulator transcription factor [Firmicutes bacterium]|nr:response regulator transcription factor [Bacillota bacterium]